MAAQSVIEQNPGETTAYRELGLNHLYLGQTSDAAGWFGRADRIAPQGAFWGIGTHISDYGLPSPVVNDSPLTASLELIRTRLNQFSAEEQGHLINWGYALTDAAMRRWVLPGPPSAPGVQPDPAFPL